MKESSCINIGIISVAACILLLFLASCAKYPIRDGGLAINNDTVASVRDLGVASLNSKF